MMRGLGLAFLTSCGMNGPLSGGPVTPDSRDRRRQVATIVQLPRSPRSDRVQRQAADSQDVAIKNAAAAILSLDRLLARYGPETAPTRAAAVFLIFELDGPFEGLIRISSGPSATHSPILDARSSLNRPRDAITRIFRSGGDPTEQARPTIL